MYDFAVRYNPEKETQEQLTKKILYSLFIRPIREGKPRVLFIGGDSGEGKSLSSIRLQEIFCELQGIDIEKHFEDINVFTPIEYPKKIDRLLNDKELKKVNLLCMHEARDIIKSKDWHSFLTQSVADVNAQSRSIKRICFMIISQFIRDITSDIRYTLNYYITVKRNASRVKMSIMKVWKDDSDLEKPKLRKRRVFGYVIYPNGKKKKLKPDYFIIQKPKSSLVERFDKLDTETKRAIIKRRTDKMVQKMELDLIGENTKIANMVAWYMKKPEDLNKIGKMKGEKFLLDKKFNLLHDLTKQEKEEFVKLIQAGLTKKGIIEKRKTDAEELEDKDENEKEKIIEEIE